MRCNKCNEDGFVLVDDVREKLDAIHDGDEISLILDVICNSISCQHKNKMLFHISISQAKNYFNPLKRT